MGDEQKTVEGLSGAVVWEDLLPYFPRCAFCKKPILNEKSTTFHDWVFHPKCFTELGNRVMAIARMVPATTLRDTE